MIYIDPGLRRDDDEGINQRLPKIIHSPNLTDAITDDSYSNECLASSTDTIHADSCFETLPLLYSSLNITKIVQSLNLTDAITDDSYSNEYLA